MTNAESVYQHLKRLPDSIAAQVFDFVQFLEQKNAIAVPAAGSATRHPSTAGGQVWMAPDFDAPLEDFKDC